MAFAVSTGLRDASFHTLTENLALELRKNGQHPGHGPPRRCGEVSRFTQRNEAHAQGVKLLERPHQISQGPAPPIQAPDHNGIDVSTPCGAHELFPLPPLADP
jgi:hypothetical protein